MLGKKSSEKSAKNVFLYLHKYRYQKMGGGKKRAKQFFQKHKNSAIKKCWEKNRRKKVRKNFFLYSHENRDQKMGGTKRVNQFFQEHTNSASKKCWEKNRRKKVRNTFFYIHTIIVTKK